MIQHTKAFGVYHWDTFDNDTILIGESKTQKQAHAFVQKRYKGRISGNGADKVDIVDKGGNIVGQFSVG